MPIEEKDRIKKVAVVSDVTVTDFANTALAETVDEVLEKPYTRILSNRDRDIFLDMLGNPPEPNETLLKAVEDYNRRVIISR